MTDILRRLGDIVAQCALYISGAAMLVIVAINGANVFARYFLRNPFSWAEEAMLYTMITGVFAGAITIAWQQRHISIEAFLNFAPPGLRRTLHVVAVTISICVLGFIGYVGSTIATRLFEFDQRSDALRLPTWIPHTAVATTFFLIAVVMLLRLIVDRGERPPTDHAGENESI